MNLHDYTPSGRCFQPGDIVRYTRTFLRSVGYATPPTNGKVVTASPALRALADPEQTLTIEWCDGSGSTTSARIIEFDPWAG